jgi:thiol-disulfide isomerase/thioredoxin
MQSSEVPGEHAQVVVLHLWADWCVPCREEFPVLRQTLEAMNKSFGERVQVVLLSETASPEAMRAFLDKYKSLLPSAPHYLDTGETIASGLRTDLPTTLSYPMTLVLDSRRSVRHAVVGSIGARRLELMDAIARILAQTSPEPPPAAH